MSKSMFLLYISIKPKPCTTVLYFGRKSVGISLSGSTIIVPLIPLVREVIFYKAKTHNHMQACPVGTSDLDAQMFVIKFRRAMKF